ncbi:MAG: phosphoribosylglycinamide formyltransferase [Eubacteriales bacterium]|nr:phosphoribosylglycinamide formyltransferase [Eubacteriales bacterium]
MERLVVMVSGSGTNLQAILDACGDGRIPAKVVGVISNKQGVYALERAEKAGVPGAVIMSTDYKTQEKRDAAVINAVESFGGQAIILAGYMSILGRDVVDSYKTVNVHPALIPSFCGKGYYGLRVHKAVLDYGAKVSGATVHFVDEGMDTGPIIMQKSVDVQSGDTPETLAARVLEAEHEILVKSVRYLCEGKLTVCGRRVIIEESGS